MAKPPIIISNGGIVEYLAQGIEDPKAEQKIMKNLAQLNKNTLREDGVWSVAKWITGNNPEVPMIFWHLTDDDVNDQLNKLRSKFKDKDIKLGEDI